MTLFPEWQEKQKRERVLPVRIRAMYSVYGRDLAGRCCSDCRFFLRFKQSARWSKCAKSKITGGAATDWRARWPACGLFEDKK